MTPLRSIALVLAVALLVSLCGSVSAARGIEVALGETVPLSGYSYGSPWAYLFLTGPNLPVNGVPLNDVSRRADQGYFTRVDVDGDNRWSYNWNTANAGGKLDEGTYTVWVVNGPNDLSRLAEADYGTISVTLKKPSVTVDSVQPAGSMEITSVPSGATVMVNDVRRGTTPLTLPDLAPGTYRVTFTLDKYAAFSTPVTVEAGRISEVRATLAPLPEPTAAIPATPQAPATMIPLTTPAAMQKTPGFLPAACLCGIILAWGMQRRRE